MWWAGGRDRLVVQAECEWCISYRAICGVVRGLVPPYDQQCHWLQHGWIECIGNLINTWWAGGRDHLAVQAECE